MYVLLLRNSSFFFLFCCFSVRFSLKISVRLIFLFDRIARKRFLAQVGSLPVFGVTGWNMRQDYAYFEHKLSLTSSIEEAVGYDEITLPLGTPVALSRFDSIVNGLS